MLLLLQPLLPLQNRQVDVAERLPWRAELPVLAKRQT